MRTFKKPLIRLEAISKVFVTDEVATHALSGIHLEIAKGDFLCIAGPSGCGKSTLLSIMGLLDPPSGGRYRLHGEDITDLPVAERARIRNSNIGFVFQSFNLLRDLTVFENVELPLLYRKMSAAERRSRVKNILERVGMSHREKHHPTQLSGGQQQRVAIARALVGNPLILLADEPTGNLDSKYGAGVMELLEEINNAGATICMVTHDQRYARNASRAVLMMDGRIIGDKARAA